MNHEKFYQFWLENIKGKGVISVRLFTESYFHLYGKQYMGPTCSKCIQSEGQILKNIFNQIHQQKLLEQKQKLENETTNEKPEEPENKGKKTTKNVGVKRKNISDKKGKGVSD